MRVIDSHVHLYPPEVNRDPAAWAATAGELHWAVMCARVRKNGRPVQAFPSVDELLREMDAAGVAHAVLLGWYWNRPETCAMQNRFYAGCVRMHPDRLNACATIHPGAGVEATLAEMWRARDEGMIGLGELSPHSQGVALDDAAWLAALALADEWGWPANVHVTDPDSRPYPGRVETPLADFVRTARAFPGVNFVLAHWGALLPLRDPEVLAMPKVYFDTAASPLLYGPDVWTTFLAAAPAERVLFGSDHPLNLYPKIDAGPAMTRFIAEARAGGAGAAVLGGNAARVFGL